MAKFTFKKVIHTGRFKSFEDERHEIKLDKVEVGYISVISGRHMSSVDPALNGKFKIWIQVEKERTKENPAPFKWMSVKRAFDTVDEAKSWLISNSEKVQTDVKIYRDPAEIPSPKEKTSPPKDETVRESAAILIDRLVS